MSNPSNKRPHAVLSSSSIISAQTSNSQAHSKPNQSTYLTHPIYHTPTPIHDRSSTFKAIFSPSAFFLSTPKKLQAHPDFESASHRILAWRRPARSSSKSQSTLLFSSSSSGQEKAKRETFAAASYETGSDEDGEKYAGSKLEKLLDREAIEGVVVVARWYGGVMLGPVRFKWIEDVARGAVAVWRGSTMAARMGVGASGGVQLQDGSDDGGGAGGGKRRKVEGVDAQLSEQQEKVETERLVRLLKERDGSVSVLRALLAEKNSELEGPKEESVGVPTTTTQLISDDNDQANISVTNRQEPQMAVTQSTTASSQTTPSTSEIVKPPTIDYDAMPLQRLRQLEKARDATLGWILKQIDAVEVKLKDKERGKVHNYAKDDGIDGPG